MSFRSIVIACSASLFVSSTAFQPAQAQSRAVEPVAVAKPELTFLMRLYAPLQAPQKVDDSLVIFQPRPGGYVAGPQISGEIISPTADWVRIMPDGTMRIDVRSLVKMNDGSTVLVTYGGVLSKPSAESWTRFMAGEKISTPEWYYVVALALTVRIWCEIVATSPAIAASRIHCSGRLKWVKAIGNAQRTA